MEWLRGCAILAVIAIHTTAQFVTINALNSLVATAIVVDVLSHFAVPLFVGLSGFVLATRYPGWQTGRKLSASITADSGDSLDLTSCFRRSISRWRRYTGVQLSWRGVALGLLLGSAQGHLWFFVLIAQLYLLFPLLIRAAEAAERHHSTPAVLAATLTVQLAWNVGVLALPAQTGRPEWQALLLSYRVFASHLFYFVLGIVAARQGSLMVRWLRRPSGGILVAAVVRDYCPGCSRMDAGRQGLRQLLCRPSQPFRACNPGGAHPLRVRSDPIDSARRPGGANWAPIEPGTGDFGYVLLRHLPHPRTVPHPVVGRPASGGDNSGGVAVLPDHILVDTALEFDQRALAQHFAVWGNSGRRSPDDAFTICRAGHHRPTCLIQKQTE